jgi:hypothetical protein
MQTRRSVSMSGVVYARLKKYCDAKGLSMSGYVQQLISDDLDRHEPTATRPPSTPVTPPKKGNGNGNPGKGKDPDEGLPPNNRGGIFTF